MRVNVAAKTDKGRLCDHNEDYYVARRDLGLYMAADGVGGSEAGELASNVACRLVEQSVRDALGAGGPASRHDSILGNAIREANVGLYEYAQREGQNRGLGTTLTALWFHGDRVLFAYVGDSRIYLFRDGVLRQLSRDEKAGRYRLAASLGTERPAEPHLGMVRLRRGDRFLLCTDGLYGSMARKELTFILDSQREPVECCERLIFKANQCDGSDNITALVADVAEADPRQAWRFSRTRYDATSALARLVRLSWLLGVAVLIALGVLGVVLLGPRRHGGAPKGPAVSARPALLAREANEKARAGDEAATLAALKDLIRAGVRERAVIPRAALGLDPAAARFLDQAAEAVWDEYFAPARQKLDALAGTPAESYAQGALRATRQRLDHVHRQFLDGDYRFVSETVGSLGKEVDTIIARAQGDLEQAKQRLAKAIEELRRKAAEFEPENPLRGTLERHVAAAAKALAAGKVSEATGEVDAAEAALKDAP